ncbi:MAG: succinate dehydrogenase, cytochrome b556 subunit, partial [Chloroflexi bacterium]|nr:succinate dehydrogenase, cytochrome b556 subunit [Chloroflexota bacterium]
ALVRFSAVIAESVVYRGREGQWAYLVHRVAGLCVLLFLGLHVFDIYLVGFGPEVFNATLFLYKGPAARVLEVLLAFGLLFHALNGLRIIIQDFVPRLMRYHRRLFWVQAVIFSILFIPAGTFMLKEFFGIAGGLLITLALWALVPLAVIGQYVAPTPLTLNVAEVGGER